MDWDDVRYFLAVAREGSTLAAARRLGVNQTTVARRIAELEAAVGGPLFERLREGYRLLPGAERLRDAAERMAGEADAFAELARAVRRGVEVLRVTTNEPLANAILAPAIRAFAEIAPEVRVELVISPRQLDLGRGEADVALRAAPLPDDPDLVARKVGEARWAVYCSREYAERHGAPSSPEALSGRTLLCVGDPSGSRLAELDPTVRAERRDTLNDVVVAIRAGLGVASLPCVLGDGYPDFVRAFVQREPVTPVWLIRHARLKGRPEVDAFLDAVAVQAHLARSVLVGGVS